MAGARSFLRNHWIILIVLVLAAAVRDSIISRPFIGNQHGTVAGIPLCVARNYARYGPFASRLAGVMNSGRVAPELWAIYSHHPPLVPLLVGGAYRIAGVSEWTSRFTSACFAIANTALLYAMGRRYFDLRVAVLAAIFYAFCPATLVFGDMPDYVNVQVVFFILSSVIFYARWRETKSIPPLVGLAISFIFGACSDWTVFYLVPLLGLHFLIADGLLRGSIRFIPFAFISVVLFGILAWWMTWSGGDVSMLHQIGVRMAGKLNDRVPITPFVWLKLVVHRNAGLLHTYPVLLLALLYLAGAARSASHRQFVPLMLLGLGAIHSAVAIQANVQHMFWSVIFTPGLCLAGAVACGWLMVRPFVAAPLLIAFAACSIPQTWRLFHTQYSHLAGVTYTQKQLGSLIQRISRDDEGVMTSDSYMEPELWFYADRQLIPAITTVAAFEKATTKPLYVLPFSYPQRGGPVPTWFVMPLQDRAKYPALAAMLDSNYDRELREPFDVYHLTRHAP